ncbi:MAG: TldD/PmbA family protein, partial [Anaerolineales bacterium]|nr:TldD/PmbA family protein [Anaerolineales bacterium]
MRELTDRALNVAEIKGATYADIRIVRRENQGIVVKNGKVEALSQDENQGFGVRVILNGAWGFASSSLLSLKEVERVTALAVEIARASALVKTKLEVGGWKLEVGIGRPVVYSDTYRTPVKIDPFQVPLDRKIELLMAADAEMRLAKGVAVAQSNLQFVRERKVFASSEGSFIEQEIIEGGGGLEATAVGEDDVQKRSYPNSFGRHQGTAGYELIEGMDLVGNAQRVGAEAVALLTAPQCPSLVTTLILGATQLALQVHESCGHP